MNSNLITTDSSNNKESNDDNKIPNENKQACEDEHLAMNKASADQHDILSISLPVVPMKTLLEAYTQKKVYANNGAENTDYFQTRNSIREMMGSFASTDSSYSDELQSQLELDFTENTQKCEETVSENVLQICKKLEDLVTSQSSQISQLTTEVKELKKWRTSQERIQATLVIQKYWRKVYSSKTSIQLSKDTQTDESIRMMEKINELNNEVIIIKDFLKNVLEQSMKEGKSSITQSQDTTDKMGNFIEDLQAVIQTDSSLLLTWSLYTSAHTIGFYIYINGHQVGMVGSEKTKALLEGLNPTAYYKIYLVEQTSTFPARESNPVFVCIDHMKSIHQEQNIDCNNEQNEANNNPNNEMQEYDQTVLNENTQLHTTQLEEETGIALSSSEEVCEIKSRNEDKKELNRTYELENQLIEIRQQLTEGNENTEQQTDSI